MAQSQQEKDIDLIKRKVAIAFRNELVEKANSLDTNELIKTITFNEETQFAEVLHDGVKTVYEVDETVNYIITKSKLK